MRARTLPVAILLALALGGCGASKSQTQHVATTAASSPASAQSVQACLERLGYEVNEHPMPRVVEEDPQSLDAFEVTDVEGAASTPGGLLGSFNAEGASGLGEATVAVYSTMGEAQKAASEAEEDVEKSESTYREEQKNELPGVDPPLPADGKPGWNNNVAFAAWTDTALASENVAGCAG